MPISFSEYVDIVSGVDGGSAVAARALITRIFTINPLVPANSYAEFSSAEDVGAYFGTTSVEYARASFYFNFISKLNRSPQLLSFASWVQTNRAPSIYGDPKNTATLAAFQAITAGSLDLTLNNITFTISGLDFAADTSLTAVAATVQTAIRGAEDDPVWVGATVTFNPSSPQGAIFELLGGGTAGAGNVAVTPVTGSPDVGAALGWESAAAIISQGAVAESLTNTMVASNGASNNFATFCYIPTLSEAQILELQTWNETLNVTYMGLYQVTSSDAEAVSTAIIGTPGGAMTLAPLSTEFPEMLPGMILASTDYTRANASQSYMYQQTNGLTPSVADDLDQMTYDNLRVNYYGQTQEAGQPINFYQRGVLTGGVNAATDMNVYANEIWLKSTIADAFLTALLQLTEIPVNNSGQATGLAILGSVINQALTNGVISVGKTLTPAQINAITQLSNSPNAWQQVQTIGYWVAWFFSSSVTPDGRTEYQGNYTLIYSKNDAIRKINGTHSLI